jgi:hypothetical protein
MTPSDQIAKLNHEKRMKEAMLARVLEENRLMEEQEGKIRTELTHIENKIYSLINRREVEA